MGWSQGANTTFIDYLYFTKLLTAEGESGYIQQAIIVYQYFGDLYHKSFMKRKNF